MSRNAVALLLAFSLAGCDAVGTLTDGFKYKAAVEEDLAKAIGVKPQVGFNWTNGRLALVTVLFPKVYDGEPLSQLAEIVRRAVTTEFKQTPESIELAFLISNRGAPTAQLPKPQARTKVAVALD
jgi:hypothetical protein